MSRWDNVRGSNEGRPLVLGMRVFPDVVSAMISGPTAGPGKKKAAENDRQGPAPGPVPFTLLVEKPVIGEAAIERNVADIDLLARMLGRAVETREKGVNVFFRGRGDSSREEFARVLAARIGCELFRLATPQEGGKAVRSLEALQRSVLVAQRGLSRLGRPCMLLVVPDPRAFPAKPDNDDDLPPWMMPHMPRVSMSAWKKLLSKNPVVALWRYDGAWMIDGGLLGLFDHVVEVAEIPPAKRVGLVTRHLGDVPVSPEWVARLAAQDGLTVTQIERAVRAARLAGCETASDAEAVMQRVISSGMSMAGKKVALIEGRPATAAAYDLGYLNASVDVVNLVDRLAAEPRGRILLYGPPGTGKTCLAKHVADRAGRELVSARASDLLDKWVGETEKHIAALFAKARAREAILLLDEADSFLGERKRAVASWEVAHVNELLVNMEAFEGLFICSTNLIDNLDAASFRRFDLKIRFDPMTRDQAFRMLTSMLVEMVIEAGGEAGRAELRELLAKVPPLTPGDFAAVRRRISVTGEKVTPADLVAMLHGETSMREPARACVGFSR